MFVFCYFQRKTAANFYINTVLVVLHFCKSNFFLCFNVKI